MTYEVEEQMRNICSNDELTNLSEEFLKYEQNYLVSSEKELMIMLGEDKLEQWAQRISFDDLCKLTFNKAHDVINKITIKKRIQLLDALRYRLESLYQATKAYNDQMFGKSMPPKDFMSIMGKIKHMEILQAWLFGIE